MTIEVVYRIYEVHKGLLLTPKTWYYRREVGVFSDGYETMEAALAAIDKNDVPGIGHEFTILPVTQRR